MILSWIERPLSLDSARVWPSMSIIDMSNKENDLPYGTLDLLVLKTLDTMGLLHGYGIARRIEQMSETLRLSQGSIYPALIRLEQQGWIRNGGGHFRDQPEGEVLLAHPAPDRSS